jgi:hypothetical protein
MSSAKQDTRVHPAVAKARTKLARRVSTMFLPVTRLADRLPKPAQRCPGCGYWVQGACSTCEQEGV